jgi:hypothetical protein
MDSQILSLALGICLNIAGDTEIHSLHSLAHWVKAKIGATPARWFSDQSACASHSAGVRSQLLIASCLTTHEDASNTSVINPVTSLVFMSSKAAQTSAIEISARTTISFYCQRQIFSLAQICTQICGEMQNYLPKPWFKFDSCYTSINFLRCDAGSKLNERNINALEAAGRAWFITQIHKASRTPLSSLISAYLKYGLADSHPYIHQSWY